MLQMAHKIRNVTVKSQVKTVIFPESLAQCFRLVSIDEAKVPRQANISDRKITYS